MALGGDYRKVRLTLQEYFEKLGPGPSRWGKPFGALLGRLSRPEKAWHSGHRRQGQHVRHFHGPDRAAHLRGVRRGHGRRPQGGVRRNSSSRQPVVLIPAPRDAEEMPDFAVLTKNFAKVHELIAAGKVLAAHSVRAGGVAAAVSKMASATASASNLPVASPRPACLPPNTARSFSKWPATLNLQRSSARWAIASLGAPRPGRSR